MHLTYGVVRCKIVSDPKLVPSRHGDETQYHLHATLEVTGEDGSTEQWDSAINVGTNNADDALTYKLVFNFRHGIVDLLKKVTGFQDLTGTNALPALDFLRSDLLAKTGAWRPSDPMDGSVEVQPVASLLRLLRKARSGKTDVWIFGRTYTSGGKGMHDVHMNQGSTGSYVNDGKDNHNDHNDIWQDGAVIADAGDAYAAYFTAFTQQKVPTDNLGNPTPKAHQPIQKSDEGSLT